MLQSVDLVAHQPRYRREELGTGPTYAVVQVEDGRLSVEIKEL